MSFDNRVAFCFADLVTVKQASLLYNSVVPFPFEALSAEMAFSSQCVVDEICTVIPSDSYNNLLGGISILMAKPDMFGRAGHEFRVMFLVTLLAARMFATDLKNSNWEISSDEVSSLFPLAQFGVDPIIVLPEERLRSSQSVPDDVSVILSNIPLIDTKSASWDQIVQVRKNKDSQRKLRNLRLFLHTNYANKSRQFIEDDLGKRLDDYDSVVRDYGFETTASALTLVTTSQNLVAFGTASIAAAILGSTTIATASVITGVSMEIGKLTLEIFKQRHVFQKMKRNHELSYILDIRSRFGVGN